MARSTVLAYHAVGPCAPEDDPYNLWVSAAAFRQQMAFLARRRRVVGLDELLADAPGRGAPRVAITFDDAYRCLLEHAVPVLEEHGFPATVFLPTAYLGDRNRWNPPQACDLSIVDADEVRDLEQRGITFESHGHRHIDMREADVDDVRDDLQRSREVLEEVVGRVPRHLAWPFRDGAPAARGVAEELGFATAFSIDLPDAGRFSRARVQVTPLDGAGVFAVKTSGRWLDLRHHPVADGAYRVVRGLLPTRGRG